MIFSAESLEKRGSERQIGRERERERKAKTEEGRAEGRVTMYIEIDKKIERSID